MSEECKADHAGMEIRIGLLEKISALEASLAAARKELYEQARLNGMGGEREAALLARIDIAEKERDKATAESTRWHGELQKETLERSKVIDEYANFRKCAALDLESAYTAAFDATHEKNQEKARAEAAERERDDIQARFEEQLENKAKYAGALAGERIMRDAAEREVERLLEALELIRDKWVPALRRDALEADKTMCNAESIFGVVVRALAALPSSEAGGK